MLNSTDKNLKDSKKEQKDKESKKEWAGTETSRRVTAFSSRRDFQLILYGLFLV